MLKTGAALSPGGLDVHLWPRHIDTGWDRSDAGRYRYIPE